MIVFGNFFSSFFHSKNFNLIIHSIVRETNEQLREGSGTTPTAGTHTFCKGTDDRVDSVGGTENWRQKVSIVWIAIWILWFCSFSLCILLHGGLLTCHTQSVEAARKRYNILKGYRIDSVRAYKFGGSFFVFFLVPYHDEF